MKVRVSKDSQLALKRAIDIFISIFLLGLLVVPFLIISLAIKFGTKGPVFFRQERIGKNSKPFIIWKFRTMIPETVGTKLGHTLAKDDPRITGIGNILRSWGLDELPQLINVLKGEMSIVGPRPTLKYQVERYSDFQRKRLLMKPGIAGWALIHGRNLLSWEERIKYDVWYVENWSLLLDITIMLKTPWVVLVAREGIYGKDGINDDFLHTAAKREMNDR